MGRRGVLLDPARGLGLVLPPGIGTGADARRVRPLVELEVEATEEGLAATGGGGRLGLRQRAVLRALAAGPKLARQLAVTAGSDRATLRRLEARGLIRSREVERRRHHSSPAVGAVRRDRADRRSAARTEGDCLGGHRELLLHGVTGSGKTEIYLEAAREALDRGRGAIVLVPEIALTPQIMDRFRRRFGESVALLHSRMPAGARYDEWRRLRAGEGSDLRRSPLRRVRPVRDPVDRDRRGARLLLQAGVRPALRRSRGGSATGGRGGRGAAGPPPRGRRVGTSSSVWSCPAGWTAAAAAG